jgi:hypothetical protein
MNKRKYSDHSKIRTIQNMYNFIEKNREAFDVATAPETVWANVDRVLERWPQADALEQCLLLDRPLLDTEAPAVGIWDKIQDVLDRSGAQDDTNLEAFIRTNRDDFDVAVPNPGAWSAVERALTAPETMMVWRGGQWQGWVVRIAAAVALLLTGLAVGIWYAKNDAAPVAASKDGIELREMSSEYAELQDYYERDIAGKAQKLATFTSNTDTELNNDLEQMDRIMAELRHELADVPPANREQVVKAMIETYKAKAAILSKVLDQIENTTEKKKEDDDSIENM